MPFLNLQNAWYNALTGGLGLSRNTFQMLQPAPPLVANDDRRLWDSFFNLIPPRSLTQNFVQNGGAQFFSNYTAMIGALRGVPNTIRQDIGEDNFRNWKAFLQSQSPPIPPSKYPETFFAWAFIEAPEVASIGAAAYSSLLLDPISTAGVALTPYIRQTALPGQPPPPPPLPPDWNNGYSVLAQQISAAPAISFAFNSSNASSDVRDTWTSGGNSFFFGLFGGGGSESHAVAETFANSAVRISASFGHVLNFFAVPGSWYTSSTAGIAFVNQGDPPWNPTPGLVRWDNTFSDAGSLARFTTSLIVVDTMQVHIESEAHFSDEQRQAVFNNSFAGLWPFYSSGSGSGVNETARFTDDNQAIVDIQSAPGVPIVIGANVLPVSTFVGHAVEGNNIFARLQKGELVSSLPL